MYAGVTKSLKFIIQLTKENVVYRRYSVTHLTWIPIKMPFLGRRKPVDIKALRKAVWAFAPKQATYTEVNKQHFRIWKQGLQSNIVLFWDHDGFKTMVSIYRSVSLFSYLLTSPVEAISHLNRGSASRSLGHENMGAWRKRCTHAFYQYGSNSS